MARLEIIHVTKRYRGDALALDDVSLEVPDQEFLVLLGPSGCGKSTMLKLIAGLEDLTAGEIYIDDRLVNYTAPVDRDVAMVFQNYALYPHMTVADNIGFPLRMKRFPRNHIRERVREVARILEIEGLLERKPEALSGGQRQRVALGRAIIREPKAFLMDEPLSNLDAKLRVQMREELLELHRRVGGTVLYVTHDQVEAMTMGNRLVVLREGTIQQVGHPQEVYDHPVNTYVATFVGSPQMSLVMGRLESSDGGVRFLGAGLSVPVDDALPGTGAGDDEGCLLGIRSEDVLLANLDGLTPQEGLIQLLEPVGSDIYARIRVQDESIVARAPAHATLREGERIRFGFRPQGIRLFHRDGRALDAEVTAIPGSEVAGV